MAIGLGIISNTGITRHQKLGFGVVFSLGLIIIAAAIVRAVLISDKAYSDIAGVAIWSVAEASICTSFNSPAVARQENTNTDNPRT